MRWVGGYDPAREIERIEMVHDVFIDRFRERGILQIDHVWHEDDGFRKCQILNKAIRETDCPYPLTGRYRGNDKQMILGDGEGVENPFARAWAAAHQRGEGPPGPEARRPPLTPG